MTFSSGQVLTAAQLNDLDIDSLSFGAPSNNTQTIALYEAGSAFYGFGNDVNRIAIYADNSATTERASITSDGRLGINTTAPARLVDISGDGTDLTATTSSLHYLVIHAAGDSGMGIYAGNTKNSYLRFADTDSQSVGGFNYDHNGDLLYIRTAGTDRVRVHSSGLYPHADNTYSLGTASKRWTTVYATDGTIDTSDAALKTDVEDSALGLNFINELRPVSYRWVETEGRPGIRRHHGFIAQEVASVLGDDASSTALWIDTPIEAEEAILEDDERGRSPLPAVEAHNEQGLRYHELVAPLVKAVQELTARLEALEG